MTEHSADPAPPSWHALPVDDVLRLLRTDRALGLTGAEAAHRLAAHGSNELPETPPRPVWRTFVRQFKSPLIHILFVAAVLAIALGQLGDAGVILAVVVVNALIGTVREGRAERSMAALRRLSALRVLACAVVDVDAIDANPFDAQAGLDGLAGRARLLGLLGQIDPPRDEARAAAATCRAAGIRVVMVSLYLFATSIDEVVVLLLALFAGYPLPLAEVQILWINIVTEGTLTVNLVMDPPDGDEMRRNPVPRDDPLVDRGLLLRVALMASAAVVATFGWFAWRVARGSGHPDRRGSHRDLHRTGHVPVVQRAELPVGHTFNASVRRALAGGSAKAGLALRSLPWPGHRMNGPVVTGSPLTPRAAQAGAAHLPGAPGATTPGRPVGGQ